MIRFRCASLVLNAMTLRGIGSYLMGERLEFKPLTVICGTNGSGKSTWLKALNVLTKSLALNRLPYGFEVSDWDPNDIKFTSAFYHLASQEDANKISDSDEDDRFGPPGTVGLEIGCENGISLGTAHSTSDPEKNAAWNLLWAGCLSPGSRLRLRIAHPTYWSDAESTPHLEHLIEIQLNGTQTIRLRGERDALQRFEEGIRYPRRTKPYVLEASESLITGEDNDTDAIVQVATVYDLNNLRFDSLSEGIDAERATTLLRLFEERFCEILKQTLGGYFYIGAIRHPHISLGLTAAQDAPVWSCTSERHVGASGERAWQREAEKEKQWVRFDAELLGDFQRDDIDVEKFLLRLSAESRKDSVSEPTDDQYGGDYRLGLRRLWEFANPDLRREIERLQNADPNDLPESAADSCAAFLNSVVSQPNLFDAAACETELSRYYDQEDGDLYEERFCGNDELARLCRVTESTPTTQELRYRNFLFILHFLEGNGVVSSRWECQFQDYLSAYLLRLTGNQLQPSFLDKPQFRTAQWTFLGARSRELFHRPAPILIHWSEQTSATDRTVTRVIDPCFGTGFYGTVQPPRQLSAGFHQLFPIMVQLGLMKSGELIAIENPEVHLHPSLQLRITEALIDHAKSGRRILIETHSDLVIRRIMRSLLAEDLPQECLHIYFADLKRAAQCSWAPTEDASVEFHGSSLERLKVDSKGRIVNWPKGFLDEDVLESQRLLDIMYGNSKGADDDDE